MLALVVIVPWAARPWAPPILSLPSPTPKVSLKDRQFNNFCVDSGQPRGLPKQPARNREVIESVVLSYHHHDVAPRKAGTGHRSTSVSNQAESVAPSKARQADGGTPSSRTAAVSVVIFQWPCGTGPSTRTPEGARPWVRSIAVLAPDSSTKTNRAGSIAANSRRQDARSAFSSGRSCSAARRDFFSA